MSTISTSKYTYSTIILFFCSIVFLSPGKSSPNIAAANKTDANKEQKLTIINDSNRNYHTDMFKAILPEGWLFSAGASSSAGFSVVLHLQYPRKVSENFSPSINVTQGTNGNCLSNGDWSKQNKKEFITAIKNKGYKKTYERIIRGKHGKPVHELIFVGNETNPALSDIKMNASIIVGKKTFYTIQYTNIDKYFKQHYKYYIKLLKSFEITDDKEKE